MKGFGRDWDLWLCCVALLAQSLVIAHPIDPVARLLLSLETLFFVPGYLVMASLSEAFPEDVVGAIMPTFGVSIATVVVVAMVLNETAWGIAPGLYSSVLTMIGVVLAAVSLARRRKSRIGTGSVSEGGPAASNVKVGVFLVTIVTFGLLAAGFSLFHANAWVD